ncbi:MAG: OadG family protein [Verrucomicrobia bacterium]|nr:OadG family protein [Verrucomicrobiota bacterium]MDA1006456.1 OadG family protein [Verrucomicrobiota bacterium]
MDGNIINEGVELMGVGMGVVFAFLILLVGFMTLCGAFFQKFSHLFAEPPQPDAPKPGKAGDVAAKVAVAIAAAHRARHDR